METGGGEGLRAWPFWSRAKLGILEEYLAGFLTASSSQSAIVYLDTFAGQGRGRDQLTGEVFQGSPRIALEVRGRGDRGRVFSHLRYFERPAVAPGLESELRADHPERDVRVYGGDCNQQLPKALRELHAAGVGSAPTFAFVDPDGLEVRWDTLKTLASHKTQSRFKVELWLLFATPGLQRTLELPKPSPEPSLLDDPAAEPEPPDEAPVFKEADAQGATALFGTDRWRAIYDRRSDGRYDGRQARNAYLNLMRWQLEQALGYRWTHPLEIKSERGVPLYHMIFVTDNPAGNNIMTDIYGKAAAAIPQMAAEARERRREQTGEPDQAPLFADDVAQQSPAAAGYSYMPPEEPPPMDRSN
jgi:hypothetical protein